MTSVGRAVCALALLVTGLAHADAPWTDAAGTDIEIRPNVVYTTASGQDLHLDLFLPIQAQGAKKPLPLVVYVHGGGWVAGSKEIATLRLLPYMQMGWATALVQYRLAKTAPAPAAVEDVRCAVRYLEGHAEELRIDPQKVVLSGGSAGSHLALIAGMLPAGTPLDRACATDDWNRWRNADEAPLKVAAIVNWFGITDVADLLSGPHARHYAVEWFGAMPEPERTALAKEISPLFNVRADTPPIITIHGDADDVVPYAQAQALHAALDKAGRPNVLVTVPGAKHGMNPAQATMAAQKIRKFLDAQGIR